MIHGQAADFVHDNSDRIILAHSALPLTIAEKVTGSSAPFGPVDVLIPDYSDIQRQLARMHMLSDFPEVDPNRLTKLLNNPIVTFQPGSEILKKGDECDNIYLIITGIVEMLSSIDESSNILPSGGMIGEYAGLHGFLAETTFRSVSYVRALVLPTGSYLKFVKRNQLYSRIERLHENR